MKAHPTLHAILAAACLSVAASTAVSAAGLGRAGTAALPPLPLAPLPTPLSPVDTGGMGPQSVVPAGTCTFKPLGHDEFRRLAYVQWGGPPLYQWPYMPTIDPWNPCHMYRTQEPSNTIQRADDVGADTRWVNVFDGTAPSNGPAIPIGSTSTSMNPDLVTIAGPGLLYAQGTAADSVGLVHSQDSGAHWDRRSTGLMPIADIATQSPTSPFPGSRLAFAPSNTAVGLLRYGGSGRVYVTGDSGATWRLTSLPTIGVAGVAFDPADATHMYVLDDPAGGDAADSSSAPNATSMVIWMSTDGAADWAPMALPSSIGHADELLVTHPASGPATLYVRSIRRLYDPGQGQTTLSTQWSRSTDGGTTWSTLSLPSAEDSALAFDPTSPQDMVWAGTSATQVDIRASHDGFATPPTAKIAMPLPVGLVMHYGGVTTLGLQADRAGDFFVYRAFTNSSSSPDGSGLWSDFMAFRISALVGGSVSWAGDSATSSPTTPVVRQALPPVPEERQCPTPVAFVPASVWNSGSGTIDASPASGTLAFDGRYLDYTDDDRTPGMIFRVDGACHAAPTLTLHPGDFPSNSLPPLYELAYDPDYLFADGTHGAILAAGHHGFDDRVPLQDTPVYAVNPVSGRAVLALALRTRDFACPANSECSTYGGDGSKDFAYDVFRHGLWAIGMAPDSGAVQTGFVGMNGMVQPTCMTDPGNEYDGAGGSSTTTAGGAANWVVGAPGLLYLQEEDDQTVFEWDSRTCRVIDGFRHRQFQEPADEDEEMACDPLTFAEGAPGVAPGDGHSVLWLRDTASNQVAAYRVPDGYCPFPTALTYAGATRSAPAVPVSLCAVLAAETAGSSAPLAVQPVVLGLDGATAGSGTTDSSGRACVTATAPAVPGPHQVTARFAGTRAYLPSTTSGVLLVVGPPLPAPPPPVRPATVPRLPAGFTVPYAPPPPSVPVAQSQAQAEVAAQAQMQAQAQAQPAAHAQVGVVLQRRTQRQVATQTAGLVQRQAATLLAAATRGPAVAGAWVIALAAAMLALRVAASPRRATAMSPRSPRRPRMDAVE